MNKYRYILRYYIDPGFQEEERIAELAEFCRSATVDEVMLFFNAEETCTGHYTMEELTRWLAVAKKIKSALAGIGVDLSVNPWTTVAHEARGRTLKPGQNYTLMTGQTGRDNGLTACPLDENWLRDLALLWGKVAGELHPAAIWIEDDFRLHNHGEQLGFGGCYCRKHLDEFARRSGVKLCREELIAGIWGSNSNLQWRRIWQEINHGAFLKAADTLRKAVTDASPETGMGLMAGGFDAASEEGRRWKELQKALTTANQPLSFRPTMSPYTETWPMRKIPCNARMTLSSFERPLKIYPELESGPRHGAYSMGTACAAWAMLESACFGAHGITANCYDMLGCGIAIDKRLGAAMDAVHPRLNALAELEIDDRKFIGARILISDRIGEYAPGNGVRTASYSTEWGRVASILGFSAGFVQEITPADEPYLVNGNTLSAFSNEEIKLLLTRRVILDAKAVAELLKRGFGSEIGVSSAVEHRNIDVPYSYEEIDCGDLTIYPVKYPRLTAQRAAMSMTEFTPVAGAEILSRVLGGDHSYFFPGALFYENGGGGKIVSLAYTVGDCGHDEWFYFGYFNIFRRIFMQNIIRRIAPECHGAFVENEPLRCYFSRLDKGLFAAALNSTTDTLDGVKMRLSNTWVESAERLLPDGTWTAEGVTVTHDGGDSILQTANPIPVYEGEFFRLAVL